MTKFYTSIERYGNNILYRGYEDGLPVQQKIPYRPHLFVDSQEESKYKLFNTNKNLTKKTFDSIKDMRDFTKSYEGISNFGIYGCSDIVRQFTGTMFKDTIDWDYYQTKIWFFDIETTVGEAIDEKGNTIRGFASAEQANETIQLITLTEHHTNKIYTWSYKPLDKDSENTISKEFPSFEYRAFDSEKEMLKDFIMFFRLSRIDIISGWNSETFDVPYLVNRIKKVLNETAVLGLSPWGIVKPRTIKFEDRESITTYDILGVTHLDYIDLYKKFNPGSKESFKLDYIAEIELGKNKLPLLGESFKESYDGTFEVTKINEKSSLMEKLAYESTILKLSGDTSSDEYLTLDKEVKRLAWGQFVRYNIIDVDLLHHLELKMLQVRLAMQLGFLAKCPFGDVLSAMRLWESIIYNYFLDLNIVEVYEKDHNERHKIIGAYVHDPVPGKYGWSVSIDATALYPSFMMQNNLSPETILDYFPDGVIEDMIRKTLEGKYPVQDGAIRSPNGLITSKDTIGFIPILVKRMFDYRKQTKNLMLEKKKELEVIREKLKQLGVTI